MDSRGVIPLPAPKNAMFLAAVFNTKDPLGCETSISSPTEIALFRKEETLPLFNAFTPIDNGSFTPLQIEYVRRSSSFPSYNNNSTCWPGLKLYKDLISVGISKHIITESLVTCVIEMTFKE